MESGKKEMEKRQCFIQPHQLITQLFNLQYVKSKTLHLPTKLRHMMEDTTQTTPDGPTYGRALTGIGFNLLVDDMSRTLSFLKQVLTLVPVYADTDFAIMRHEGMEFMLHSDASYHSNPLLGLLEQGCMRGTGVELRLYGVNPDTAIAQAKKMDHYI